MEETVFLHIFKIFKLIKKIFFTSALGRMKFWMNLAPTVEFSSTEVGNSIADFTVHPGNKKIMISMNFEANSANQLPSSLVPKLAIGADFIKKSVFI